MNWNQVIRQTHRWLSIAFVAAVVTYMAAMTRGQPPAWLGIFPAGSLILMLVTGLYLFALPYALKWRGRRPAEA
jgi:cellulose synthase/poly-beta-1,6-N-acetylglucosamine synthase-like glycosyltransferase